MKPAEVRRLIAAVETLPPLVERLDKTLTELHSLQREVTAAVGVVGFLIDGALREVLPPLCPTCGAQTLHRTQRSSGAPFLGCVKYPKCKGSLDYPKWRKEAEEKLKASASPDLEGEGSVAPALSAEAEEGVEATHGNPRVPS